MFGMPQFLLHSPFSAEQVGQSLWLIVALPLAGALITGLFGRSIGRENTQIIACATVAGAFLHSVIAVWTCNDFDTIIPSAFGGNPVRYAVGHDFGNWFSVGTFGVHFGLKVDHLSGALLLVITGVGFLIHLYSTSYMEHDPGYGRYFAYLNLFVANMLTLVLSDNLLLLFVGWEGVGLCSYLLIGFWYTDPAKAWAGRKAFITNRVGDFGFLVGAMLLVLWVGAYNVQVPAQNFQGRPDQWRQGLHDQGPLQFEGLELIAKSTPVAPDKGGAPGQLTLQTEIQQGPLHGYSFGAVLTAILMLFMLGAAGKSAQLPLYVWLPDAMAGPTPVSALIHAATMVTAGVYLFCRLNFLLVLSPAAMALIAVVGALTALFAALIAFAQDDIKKVLAYSTVSQLGFMFLAVGMGVFWAAVAHLVTHAFFKACLFLGAGSVMHGNGDETDIKKLGGLRKQMPWTWLTFGVATLAITGIVPLSGFFSKDAILHGAHGTTLAGFEWVSGFVYAVGSLAALGTAFYMTRVYLLTFEGERSPQARVAHAHESAWPMTLPLAILAVMSVVGVYYSLPTIKVSPERTQAVLENYLWPLLLTGEEIAHRGGTVIEEAGGSLLSAWGIALVLAWVGGGAAFYLYRIYLPRHVGRPAPAALRTVRRWAQNKFYVDEVYDRLIIRPIKIGSFVLYKVVDALLIDTVGVRGTAWVVARVGSGLRYFQTGDAQSYAAVMALGLLAGVAYLFFGVAR